MPVPQPQSAALLSCWVSRFQTIDRRGMLCTLIDDCQAASNSGPEQCFRPGLCSESWSCTGAGVVSRRLRRRIVGSAVGAEYRGEEDAVFWIGLTQRLGV